MKLKALCFLLFPALALAQFTSPPKVTVNVGAGASVVSTLTTCSTPARGTFEFLTTDSLTYVCDGTGWRHVYTDADGTLPDVDVVVPALTFVAHATTGNHAVEVTTGARVCLDGNTCSVYLSYDGTNATVTGAPLAAAGGYTTVVANAASGAHAVELNTGALTCLDGNSCTTFTTFDGGSYSVAGAPFEAPSGVTADKLTASATTGNSGLELNTGAKACLDGNACTVYAQYDGGTVGIVGAELEVPQGFTLSTTDVQSATLAQPMSFNNLLLTEANPTGSALMLVGGARFWWTTPAINGNAHCEWDNNVGISCASALQIGAGASFFADSIFSRQGDRSVSIDQAHGLRLAPQSSIGTCDNTTGSGHSREGDLKVLSGAGLSSRTRICMCTSDGGGTPAYAWLNITTGTVGTSTACNN